MRSLGWSCWTLPVFSWLPWPCPASGVLSGSSWFSLAWSSLGFPGLVSLGFSLAYLALPGLRGLPDPPLPSRVSLALPASASLAIPCLQSSLWLSLASLALPCLWLSLASLSPSNYDAMARLSAAAATMMDAQIIRWFHKTMVSKHDHHWTARTTARTPTLADVCVVSRCETLLA